MRSKNPVVSMLEDYAYRRGPAGPSLSQGMGLSVDPNAFSVPSSLTQQTYGSSGAANTDYSRTSTPTPINVDDYLAKLFPQQAPAPQPGKWEKALGGVGNAIQGTYNGIMGYPGSYNRGAGGWSAIGSLVDALNSKNAPSPGTIGTATPLSQGGQIGAMQGIAGMDPGAMVAAMRMLGGSGVPMAPAAPSLSMSHSEPDEDQAGGPSDYDADNYTPQMGIDAVDAELNRQAASAAARTASSGFSKALGGLKGPADDGSLATALKSAAANYPTERATGRMSSGAFVGGPVNPPSMGGSPSAASMMGQRPQPRPKIMGQDYQLGDYTLPKKQRPPAYDGSGGGFGPSR